MPKIPRVSIGLLMAVVFLVAADFAIVRGLWGGPNTAVAVVVLPMTNLLLLILPGRRAGGPSRRFRAGFAWVGWPMVLLFGLLARELGYAFFWPVERLELTLREWKLGDEAVLMCLIGSVVLLYTPPQLLTALLGGWMASRYRVTIERR